MNKTTEALRKIQEEAQAYRQRLIRGEIRLVPEKSHSPVTQKSEEEDQEKIAQIRDYFEENFPGLPLHVFEEPGVGNLHVQIGSPVRYHVVFSNDFLGDRRTAKAVSESLRSLHARGLVDRIKREGEGQVVVIPTREEVQVWTSWPETRP